MQLLPHQRIVLSIDTPDPETAQRLAAVAKACGARFVKLGLELSSATSWQWCSELAAKHRLEWIADAKLNDIPNTVGAAVRAISSLGHPPFGTTIHTTAGTQAMKEAKKAAGGVKLFGVTVLTSISEKEGRDIYDKGPKQTVKMLAGKAASAGLDGIVASALELAELKKHPKTAKLLFMIPGTRSIGTKHYDQTRVTTPAKAIADGADLLVIGRQITEAANPNAAYKKLTAEIQGAT